MSSPKHIVIICSRLDLPGGIERAVVNTANLFVENGLTTTLLILDETDKSFYPINPGISIVQQALSFGITREGNIISRKLKMLSDVLRLRKILRSLRADLIISSEYPFSIAAVLSGCRKYSRLVAWEHHHHDWLKRNRFWETMYRHAYPKLDQVICLNSQEKEHFSQYAPVTVIPNFVSNTERKKSPGESKTILSVGWLIERKGIDLALKAAKLVLEKNPGWTWKWIGDGEKKEAAERFIMENGLEGRFQVIQPHADISNDYAEASLFVLSSRYEAFPMVLLEAMSQGLPVVSFDCPSGPSDIIRHGVDGLLVPEEDNSALAEAISLLINDREKRKEMGKNATEGMVRFSKSIVFQKWIELIEKL